MHRALGVCEDVQCNAHARLPLHHTYHDYKCHYKRQCRIERKRGGVCTASCGIFVAACCGQLFYLCYCYGSFCSGEYFLPALNTYALSVALIISEADIWQGRPMLRE